MVIAQIEQQVKAEAAAAKIKVGEPAPEISLPGPDGKVRKLSDYKGKVVLIDFGLHGVDLAEKQIHM